MAGRVGTTYTGEKLAQLKQHCRGMETSRLMSWGQETKQAMHVLTSQGGSYDQYKARRAEMIAKAGGVSKLTPPQRSWMDGENLRMGELVADTRKELSVIEAELEKRKRSVNAVNRVLTRGN